MLFKARITAFVCHEFSPRRVQRANILKHYYRIPPFLLCWCGHIYLLWSKCRVWVRTHQAFKLNNFFCLTPVKFIFVEIASGTREICTYFQGCSWASYVICNISWLAGCSLWWYVEWNLLVTFNVAWILRYSFLGYGTSKLFYRFARTICVCHVRRWQYNEYTGLIREFFVG